MHLKAAWHICADGFVELYWSGKESSIDKGKILEQYFIGGSVSRCKHILAQGAKGVCEMSLSQPLVISAINRRNYMYDSHSTIYASFH